MFAEVFYSNKQRTYRWQEYATEFRSKFPNVMKSIKYWKSPENAPDIKAYMETHDLNYKDKPTTSLSIAMMNLEAQIFTEILRRVYRKRWKAVHIHDCIIVPKTRGKNQPTKEQIVSIMKDVYSKYGLSPTFA
jgi:bacillopeptidase F (M6 metalloprotease family)